MVRISKLIPSAEFINNRSRLCKGFDSFVIYTDRQIIIGRDWMATLYSAVNWKISVGSTEGIRRDMDCLEAKLIHQPPYYGEVYSSSQGWHPD
jgi:hypothetical protein